MIVVLLISYFCSFQNFHLKFSGAVILQCCQLGRDSFGLYLFLCPVFWSEILYLCFILCSFCPMFSFLRDILFSSDKLICIKTKEIWIVMDPWLMCRKLHNIMTWTWKHVFLYPFMWSLWGWCVRDSNLLKHYMVIHP